MLNMTSRLALICALSALPIATFAQETDPATTEESADPAATETDSATEPAEESTDSAEPADTMEADPAATEEPADTMESDPAATTEPADTMEADPTVAEPEMAEEAAAEPVEGQIMMQGENTILADTLIGSTVYSPTDESVGDINDLIINIDGTVEGVVIGVGGFLGIGEKRVAVEMSSIEVLPNDDGSVRLILNSTKEDLEAAPAFVSAEDQAMDNQAEEMQTDPAMDPAATEPAVDGTADPAATEPMEPVEEEPATEGSAN